MSPPGLAKPAGVLRDALLGVVWAQWQALGVGATGGKVAESIVDPEALVLGSLWLESKEKRLGKLLRIWAQGGARWLSVQRTRNLAADYPTAVQERLGEFAWECLSRGRDRRWRPLAAAPRAGAGHGRERDLTTSSEFRSPAALLLRLRMGLGVGVKADVLAFLIGRAGAKSTIGETTTALGYYRRAVQRAVDELTAAAFVRSLATAPAAYTVALENWRSLLAMGDHPPRWRYWHQLLAFGASLEQAAVATAGQSPYLQSSRARDVVATHPRAFELAGVPAYGLDSAAGEAYLDPLAKLVQRLAERIAGLV